MRVVSANLWNGKVDPAWLRDFAHSLHADAVTIQEAEPRHFEALQEVLPHGTFHDAGDPSGMGFAARHPVEARFVDLGWRPAPWLRLHCADWPSLEHEPLDLLGVHIAAPHIYNPPGYGFVLRRRQMRMLGAHLAQSELPRTLMLGDFNATKQWPVYQQVSRWMTDAAIVAAQRNGRGLEPTWAPLDPGPRILRIDHAWTRRVGIRDLQVAALPGSDHSALVVDLEL